jgi:hypothetical protein
VQISKPLPLKGKPSLPRVQAPRQSRLQQRRGLRYTAPQAPSLQHIQATHQTFHHHVNHIYKKETINTFLAGNDGPTWTNALCNEYGRLQCSPGVLMKIATVPDTDTIDFIHQHEVPLDKKVTYGNLICFYRPLKTEPYQRRCWISCSLSPGDQTHYQQ